MTCMTLRTSIPRAQMPVAIKMGAFPDRKARIAASRSCCVRSPWMETTGSCEFHRKSSRLSTAILLFTKMIVRTPHMSESREIKASLFPEWSVSITTCLILAVVLPARPTRKRTWHSARYSLARSRVSLGKVAENRQNLILPSSCSTPFVSHHRSLCSCEVLKGNTTSLPPPLRIGPSSSCQS